ncbi:MAG TPA: FHA domain-containing protein [Planctomycetota bacterium]|nr:FHA domain-containing protein [Planctomycetota bacterium]
MSDRFALVFEGGPRAGERIALSGDRVTIGRKPENTIVLADSSVSGSHCELRPGGEGWVLRDLGSTNGTHFQGAKILEVKLAPGAKFTIGSVAVRLEKEAAAAATTDLGWLESVEDEITMPTETAAAPPPARAAAPAPAPPKPAPARTPSPSRAAAASAAEPAALAADAASVERARQAAAAAARRGKLLTAGALVVALAAVGGAALLWMRTGTTAGEARRAPVAVAGNKLSQPSFELEEGANANAWDLQAGSEIGFGPIARRTHSGGRALEARFDAPGIARVLSRSVPVEPGRRVRFAAFAAITGESGAAVQCVFHDAKEGSAATVRPGAAAWGESGWTRLEGETIAPPGAAQVSLALVGFGKSGATAFDDAELVLADAASANPSVVRRLELDFDGDPLDGRVRKIDRDLVAELGPVVRGGSTSHDLVLAGRAGDQVELFTPQGRAGRVGLKVEPGDSQVVQRWSFAPEGGAKLGLAFVLDRTFAPDVLIRGASTSGRFSGNFESAGCSSIVAGEAADRLRLSFDPPVALRAEVTPAGYRMELDASATTSLAVAIQFSFVEERRRALELEAQADAKEKEGAFGEALALRAQILDQFPFDRALVERTEKARDEGLAKGQKAVAAVERRVADAEFFRIPEAFRLAGNEARKLAASYAGTDVAERAKAVVDQVDASLAAVEAERGARESARLATIVRALERGKATELAEHVKAYREKYYPGK